MVGAENRNLQVELSLGMDLGVQRGFCKCENFGRIVDEYSVYLSWFQPLVYHHRHHII